MERERVVGEPTPDAVVAVIKVDPMYRLASTLGHSAAVAVARRHIDETVSAIDAEVTVVELSTTRFALLIPHGGPGALDALRSRFEAGQFSSTRASGQTMSTSASVWSVPGC
ncbi:hypothetical protein [Gordonia sp. NPDC003950]